MPRMEPLILTTATRERKETRLIDFTCLQDSWQLTLRPAMRADFQGLVKKNKLASLSLIKSHVYQKLVGSLQDTV